MQSFLTSGESHGACLVAILDGIPAGVGIHEESINRDLERRQRGFGRGGRMSIEKDTVEILSGLRNGITTGSPIALRVRNNDFKINELPRITRPRPGHADLAGALKYDRRDIRDILERSSARETASRVAAGSVCRQFLEGENVRILSHVLSIGGIWAPFPFKKSFKKIRLDAERSPVRCHDPSASGKMMRKIRRVKMAKDTVGGIFEIRVKGVRRGIGASASGIDRLGARLVFGLMSIQAVKGVEIISGIDEGAPNGDLIVLRAAMKPIATLMKPLQTVDIHTKEIKPATVERSDVTAVPACAVVGEAMTAFELARFYSDSCHRQARTPQVSFGKIGDL